MENSQIFLQDILQIENKISHVFQPYSIARMKGITVVCIIALILDGVSCEECTLKVAKLLDNDEDLRGNEWTIVTVDRSHEGNTIAKIETPHRDADINLYFANDEKNILLVNFTLIKGLKYNTPHGETDGEHVGPLITVQYKGDISIKTSTIPSHWFPENVTRMSASVQLEGIIHNYYGIFNHLVSIPDTMVVEQYKKVNCFKLSSDVGKTM